jgi:hypothetical protein
MKIINPPCSPEVVEKFGEAGGQEYLQSFTIAVP